MNRRCLGVLFFLLVALLDFHGASAQAFKSLYAFKGPENGLGLTGDLVVGPGGAFYGLTLSGGIYQRGAIFRLLTDGTLTTLHAFNGADGMSPESPLTPQGTLTLGQDGALYGATAYGGANDQGVIFRLTPDGSYTVLYHFGAGADGGQPFARLLAATNGALYGVTSIGGANGSGTLFRITTGGAFTKLRDTLPSHDVVASTALIQASDGSIYGCAGLGGDNGTGCIFTMTFSGEVNILYSFAASPSQEIFPNSLVEGGDGSFYGLAYGDKIYRVTKAGAFSVLKKLDLSANGFPNSGLTVGADGALYGTTQNGGQSRTGSIYRFTTSGSFSLFASLGAGTTDLQWPTGAVVQAADGSFYGMARNGGAYGAGGIFKIDKQGAVTTVRSLFYGPDGANPQSALIQATDGNFYGTTYRGGAFNWGTIFRMTPSGAVTTLHVFGGVDGASPTSRLIQGPDGALYGTTTLTVFRMTLAGDFLKLHDLEAAGLGAAPSLPLVLAPNGMPYGTTYNGGAHIAGSVYKIRTDGTGYTIVYSFGANYNDGYSPSSGLLRASNGSLYGTTSAGGANSFGTIFRIDSNDLFSVVHTFDGDNGAGPEAGLMQARDGNLYGTAGGGTGTGGVIYRLTLSGAYTVIHNVNDPEGSMSYCDLVQAEDGDLYGTATRQNGDMTGTVYKVSLTGAVTTLHTFSQISIYGANGDGAVPYGLASGLDGNLYGVTNIGGPSAAGTIFQIVTPKRRLLFQNQADRRIAMMTLYGTSVGISRSITPTLPEGWRVAAYADFDFDGQNDIVVQNTTTRVMAVLFLNGYGIKMSRSITNVLAEGWEVVASGDFNADGRQDLVVQNTITQQISVLLMNGLKITGSLPLDKRLLPGWRVMGVGDFDGDGFLDFVAQETATRRISVVTEQGMKVKGSVPIYPTLSEGWSVGAVSDYNGDGKPDLVVQNSSTGQISILTIANFKITGSLPVKPAPLSVWKLVGPR